MTGEAENPNPFAPSQVASEPDQARPTTLPEVDGEVCRDNAYALVPGGKNLPERCVHCNQPGSHEIPLALWWAREGEQSSLLRTRYSLCEMHKSRRAYRDGLVALVIVLGFVLPPILFGFLSSSLHPFPLLPAAMLLWCGVGIFVLWRVNTWCGAEIGAAQVEEGWIIVSGCSEPFLASLPDREVAAGMPHNNQEQSVRRSATSKQTTDR